MKYVNGKGLSLLAIMLLVAALGACRVTAERDAKAPQIIVPAGKGTYSNPGPNKVLIYCDGEVVDSLLPGQTKTLDLTHCEQVGFTPVR